MLVDLEADPLREIVERLGSASATSVIGDVTDLADMQADIGCCGRPAGFGAAGAAAGDGSLRVIGAGDAGSDPPTGSVSGAIFGV